ncbi:chemotaxis protein CheW [Psychromonas marina]|uniref:Chemotaxis protein CheW n=1 Tax=Psychromonas marina TaxID=88364 RepID=A0ABQ6E5L6_9GAMM|nr:chemotaxis protein CheW [Psychromonas marina]GLS92415.1 chemotaxis protein CheW [Psychromonas marina]
MNNNNQSQTKEYLTFWLGKEYYAIDILTVQEIRTYDQVTTVVNMPSFIKGVMNLRGVVIPIVDMRIKFNLTHITYNETTVVIILNIDDRIVGIVVDTVADVILLQEQQIQPPPNFASALDTKFIKGLAAQDQDMLVLINIKKLMNSKEMALFEQISADGTTQQTEV